MPSSPQLLYDQGHLFLAGAKSLPLELWEIKPRLDTALQNVLTALANRKKNPVFIGIEHLPLLLEKWPADKKALIIEKSSAYARLFCNQIMALPEPPSNIILVTGDLGIKAPESIPHLDSLFFRQEIGKIIFDLLALPDTLFEDLTFYFAGHAPFEETYQSFLSGALRTLVASKKFHAKNRGRYEHLRNSLLKDTAPLFLLLHHHERDDLRRHFDALIPRGEPLTFSIHEAGDPGLKNLDFALQPKSDDQERLSATDFLEVKTEKLLTCLEQQKVSHVYCRNRSPLYDLEHILFLEEALRRSGVTTNFFFIDSFFEHGAFFEGGWNFLLYCDQWPQGQTRFFTADPLSNAPVIPRRFETYYAPYRHIASIKQIAPPLPKPPSREVIAIHLVREYCAYYPEIHEMLDLLETLSTVEIGEASLTSLFHLRRSLENRPTPFSTYYFRSLVQLLHALFYAQTRIRRVLRALPLFTRHPFRIYGNGWDKFLPAQYCGGEAARKDIPTLQRQALCTIDFSLAPSPHLPHFAAVQCLSHGGLPVVATPFLESSPLLSEKSFSTACLPHFRDASQLASLINDLITHPQKRRDLIIHAQEELRHYLSPRSDFSSVAELTAEKPLQRSETLPGNLTGDETKDAFVMAAFTGYLYCLAGLRQLALEEWEPLILENVIDHQPLLFRAVQTAIQSGDVKRARRYLARAIPQTEEQKKQLDDLLRQTF